jgi:adenine-specific DNA-methyltransferase
MAARKPGGKNSSGKRKLAAARSAVVPEARTYDHPEAKTLLRPDVGTQASFRKKKPPQTYRYDSSLSPALAWDDQNAARELGEWLIALIEESSRLDPPHEFAQPRRITVAGRTFEVRSLRDAVAQLKALSRPFLDWAGKAERLSFDVPTLPLFVHERLSTKAILETLKGHRRDKQMTLAAMFADPQHWVTDQILKAYEYQDNWTNRMILGDSLVVMNSLLHYEGLGGQVQMIYMDPPYGVKFGSNFQPFVRKRDVKHNDDEDLTREPEMVKAYRDTWELGLHSYLTYMRDRLLLARDLLTPSGSIFVQISDENLHHVRKLRLGLGAIGRVKGGKSDAPERFSVELIGLDVFDPVTMETEHRDGGDVPAWLLDTDYNGLCFHVCQAFFPRTAAWDDLKRSLKGQFDDSVWDHLAGTKSEPFEAGEHGQVAVKVIDDRGNELLVVRNLREAEA